MDTHDEIAPDKEVKILLALQYSTVQKKNKVGHHNTIPQFGSPSEYNPDGQEEWTNSAEVCSSKPSIISLDQITAELKFIGKDEGSEQNIQRSEQIRLNTWLDRF